MSKLCEIFLQKEKEVAVAKQCVPISELRSQVRDMPPPLGFRSKLDLSPHPVSLIAEVKKASPSQGLIRSDFEPVQIAEAYGQAGADCLSVLTDVNYFQGSPEYLTQVKQHTGLPCLRKDFMYDPYQVYEARAWGADAILVIIAGVSRDVARMLMDTAAELNLDVLVEVHSWEETEVALEIGSDFIGVNNRNLADFTTDLAISEQIIPQLQGTVLAVSESALATSIDVARAKRAGARAVLIGTAFCGERDIESKVREVMLW
jgi:indole-3-glycerol phosphate synthase